MADNWDDYYSGAASQYNVDPQLLRAIVSVESNGNPDAISSQGAQGPAQIMPKTAKSLGVQNSFDPKQAIYGAAKLLDENIKRYGDPNKAVLAYHGGTDPNNWGPKTQDYLSKVTQAYQAGSNGNPMPSAPSKSDDELLSQWAKGPSSASIAPEDQKLLDQWSSGGAQAPAVATAPPVSGDTSGLSPLAKFGIGAVKGVGAIGNTIGNALDIPAQYLENKFGTLGGPSVAEAAQNRQESNKLYQQQFGGSTAANLGEIAGSTAATAPLLVSGGGALEAVPLIGRGLTGLRSLGVAGRIGTNALTGASQGAAGAALLSGGNNAPVGDQLTAGGMIGAALGPVAPLVSKAGGAAARLFMKNPEAAQVIDDAIVPALQKEGIDVASLPPAVQASVQKEAAAQSAAGALDPASLARKANMEELGLTPTKAMMSRDPIQWANEREAAKQGGTLTNTLQNNNAILRNHLSDIEKNSGGVASSAEDAGDSASAAVTSKFKEWQGDVSNAYKQAEQEVGPEPIVGLNGLKEAMGPLSDKTAGIPVVDAITRRLQRYGVIDKDGEWSGKLSVGNAEELRKFIADEASTDPAVNRIVRGLQNTLDGDVQSSTGSDSFGKARQLAAQRFGEIDASKITSAIMDEKVPPAQFVQKFVVGKATPSQDLQTFKDTLTTGTPDQIARGAQAFNDLKQQTAKWIQSKATNGSLDEGQISYPRMKQALDAIGPRKLAIMFGDDGATQYQKILRAAHDSSYQPGLAPVNSSNTSNALMNAAKNTALHGAQLIPTVGPIVTIGKAIANATKGIRGASEAEKFGREALQGTPMPNQAALPNSLYGAVGIPAATNYLFQKPSGTNLPQESR